MSGFSNMVPTTRLVARKRTPNPKGWLVRRTPLGLMSAAVWTALLAFLTASLSAQDPFGDSA
ncbi:MAG: hypothetical protein KDA51_12265, partial [Planctomycetales bacterium]|nr:hypothetical protein [Planctomycetales bacterium]